jgi:hypothetical protein
MLKYVSKFAMDILPSVVATIVGAYIVNHYINTKPGTDAPVAAAVSSASPKSVDSKKAAGKSDAKPAETSADVANLPEPGVRAKGISEKAILERSAVEKPAEKPFEKQADKPVEKQADKPAETASIPVETKRPAPAPREKAVARTVPVAVPVTVQPPVVAAPVSAAPVETAVAPEERRDVNDLARAAIERLRGTNETPRPQEAARTPETSRVASAPPVRPLPPPIMVSTPAAEAFGAPAGPPSRSPYAAARIDDPRRPTPPADIPDSPPLDLRAEAAADPSPREHTSVTQDVLSAAKSVFHAVLPK